MKEVINTEAYLEKFKSDNTKKAAYSLIKKMGRYISYDLTNVKLLYPAEVDLFIKKECTGKSETTISNIVCRVKDLCSYYGNENASKHLSLAYVKNITQAKKSEFLTPYEVYQVINKLINYQDKVLVLLIYLGLYDNDFETIRNLKKDQFKDNCLVLENGEKYSLNDFCSKIILGAIKETTCEKYVFAEGRMSSPYTLQNSKYILKARERINSSESDTIPSITLKKRFESFARHTDIEALSPVMLKNSKYIYDLVKLEFDENLGLDINQVELLNYCKEKDMKGSIGKLNISKKEIKDKIIKEIIEGKDIINKGNVKYESVSSKLSEW